MNRTPSPECVNPPPDLLTVIFQSRPVACYGDDDLVVVGVVAELGTWDPVLYIEPAWLGYPDAALEAIVDEEGESSLMLTAVRGPVADTSVPIRPRLWGIVIHPDLDIDLHGLMGVTVQATGHFDDPAAGTCHYTEDYADLGKVPRDAVKSCRNTFVVTAIEPQ